MASLDPEALARWSGGAWQGKAPFAISGLSNDTRRIGSGELFAALRTSKRDGHDFLDTAAKAGASGAIVDAVNPNVGLPQLKVDDVAAALLAMACGYRREWNLPVVGITGSCGKTTCKELLALMLGRENTLSTVGNLNNLIGVPMSMLRPEATEKRYAALEAGISEPGEMQLLAKAIDPDWVIVTAIGPSHLQDLGSETNVAIEKGRLTEGKRVKTVFLGESCERYAGYLGGLKAVVVKASASLEEEWSFRHASKAGLTTFEQRVYGEELKFEYRGVGDALASNVALAVAAAKSLGVSDARIQLGLLEWRGAALRGEWRMVNGQSVYVDCYNANPLSMRDALRTFVQHTPEEEPRLFVIGCMEELGVESPVFHEELGIDFPFRSRDLLLVLGDDALSVLRGMRNVGQDMRRCVAVESIDAVKREIGKWEGSVFLKGSRRYRLEDALETFESGAATEVEGGAR